MAIQTTTFKGARYIVKFHDPIEWASTESYEAIEAVQHEAFTYISKQPVPAGVQIDNTDFWLLWADPNAQMEQLRQLVEQYVGDVETLSETVDGLSDGLGLVNDALPISEFSAENTVKDSIDAEIEARKLDIEKAHVFETVADMKQGDNLSVGAICHTNGFHTSGDGGAAWYEITDTGPANEKDIIECGELFAKLVYSGNEIYVSQFGAQSNQNCADIVQRVFDVAQSGNEIVFDVGNIIIEKQVHLDVNNVILRSVPRSYVQIKTKVINDFAFLINSHGCTLENIHFNNALATSILDISINEKCIRVVDLTQADFYNIDIEFIGCSFIYYDNCITAYGKNCRIRHCMFSNSINGIKFIGDYEGVTTDQRRGLIVENNTFHGGDSSFTFDKNYDEVRTIGVINEGSSRELIIRNNVFNSDYYGYIYKGSDGGLIIDGNSCEDHTGCLGLAIITRRTDSSVTNTIISNNKLETVAATSHPQVDNPIVFDGNCYLSINGNYFVGYVVMLRMLHITNMVNVSDNFFFATRYGSEGLFINQDTATHGVILVGNVFNGGSGSQPLLDPTSGSVLMNVTNTNYLDCNYVNTNHFTV